MPFSINFRSNTWLGVKCVRSHYPRYRGLYRWKICYVMYQILDNTWIHVTISKSYTYSRIWEFKTTLVRACIRKSIPRTHLPLEISTTKITVECANLMYMILLTWPAGLPNRRPPWLPVDRSGRSSAPFKSWNCNWQNALHESAIVLINYQLVRRP